MRLQLQLQQDRATDESRAQRQANELTRLQLQMQLAQQTSASSAAHILQQHQALNILKNLPLDADQVAKRQRMETALVDMCFALADAAQPNSNAAMSAIADSLGGMAPYPPPLSAVATAPRVDSAAPRRAAGGNAANLHLQFDAVAHANSNN